MKKSILTIMCTMLFTTFGCANAQTNQASPQTEPSTAETTLPKVYFYKEISSENLIKIYEALGRKAEGKVAVKLSTGEPGGHNFLQPSGIPLFLPLSGLLSLHFHGGGPHSHHALHGG